ncbi:MAG: hypothetical protein JO266_16955 [Acidobacteria bacterium]|nr:hypothetical protein [Acidobacteriota bacterium]
MASKIAIAAHCVPKMDLKRSEAWLVWRQHVNATSAILLAIQREIIFKDEDREFARRIWGGLA